MVVHKKVDVVVMGAGWTSGIMGWKLGSAGHKVVALEAGPVRYANPNFEHNHDALKHSIHKALMYDISRETWTWRPNPKAPALPIRQFGTFNPGRGLGGASVHWQTNEWRFLSTDFRHRSHYIERYGKDKIPESMTIQDWPVTYDELEPYYDAFEYDIGTSGQAGNLNGDIIPGGNPFEAPRSRPYPNPAHPYNIPAQTFADATKEMGYHPFPQPTGILSRAYEGPLGDLRAGCIYCSFCTRHGCEVDAKSSGANVHIPAAMRTGNYEVRGHSLVNGITLNDEGLATGLNYIDLTTGEEHFQPADVVVLAGFIFSNVRMLLLSRNNRHPNGVGNDRNQVGRNYCHQVEGTPAVGVFEGRKFNQFMANSVIRPVLYDFSGDNFDHSELDFIGGGYIGLATGERDPLTSTLGIPSLTAGTDQEQSIDTDTRIPATAGEVSALSGKGNEWGKDWKENLRKNWDGIVQIGITGEWQAYDDQFLDLDPTYKDAWGRPLLRITNDYHDNERNVYRFLAQRTIEIMEEMCADRISSTPEIPTYNSYEYTSTDISGGAIMGDSPENSVTNKYGQVWDTPNVFVTGGALFPQMPGADPTGTLCPLAYMAGDAMVERYFQDPNRIMT